MKDCNKIVYRITLIEITIHLNKMRRRNNEIDLSFQSFSDIVFRDGSSLSASTASFPNHQLSLEISINYHPEHPSSSDSQSEPEPPLHPFASRLGLSQQSSHQLIDFSREENQELHFDGEESEHAQTWEQFAWERGQLRGSLQQQSEDSEGAELESMSSIEESIPDSPSFPEPEEHPGMTAQEICSLPTMVWGSMHQRFNGGEKCSVCLEEYRLGHRLRVMTCLHRFHISCLDEWLLSRASCPNCRTAVSRQ